MVADAVGVGVADALATTLAVAVALCETDPLAVGVALT